VSRSGPLPQINSRCQTQPLSRGSTPAPSAFAVSHDLDGLIPSMPGDLFQPHTPWGFVFPRPLLRLPADPVRRPARPALAIRLTPKSLPSCFRVPFRPEGLLFVRRRRLIRGPCGLRRHPTRGVDTRSTDSRLVSNTVRFRVPCFSPRSIHRSGRSGSGSPLRSSSHPSSTCSHPQTSVWCRHPNAAAVASRAVRTVVSAS
jgi:hypothetical protein